jgi:hypothetical protein
MDRKLRRKRRKQIVTRWDKGLISRVSQSEETKAASIPRVVTNRRSRTSSYLEIFIQSNHRLTIAIIIINKYQAQSTQLKTKRSRRMVDIDSKIMEVNQMPISWC